jgi:cytochrome d ubiquinol oxidase subunit II
MIPLAYLLLSGALCAYVAFDGFDLGAGTLHLAVARDDAERRTVLAAIGPYWDGNEVWLLASGGVLFAAFPKALAVAFSGFYLALFLVIWALILRGLSIELRSHLTAPLWRTFWDALFSLSSAGLALLFGVALGNLLRGVPTAGDGWFTLPFFTTFRPTPPVGLLDVYTVSVGLFAVVALAHHGALFLAWKTPGHVRIRATGWARRLFPVVVVLLLGGFASTAAMISLSPALRAAPLAVAAMGALLGSRLLASRGRERAAFLASATFLVLALLSVAATLYPTLLRSVDGAHDLTAQMAASGETGLTAVLSWAPVALALVIAYFAYVFRVHRGRVEEPAREAPSVHP